jgi:hypothetical protein
MGMYQGRVESVDKTAVEVYEFLADFRHFEKFLPEQISEWEAGDDYCKFAVQGLGKVKLSFAVKEPHSRIVIQPAPDSGFPVPFFLSALITSHDDNPQKSSFQFLVEAAVNPMIAMMVDGPLKQFVEVITVRLKDYFNNPR